MRVHNHLRVLFALAFLTVAWVPAGSARDYKAAYADGIRAVDREAWSDVVVAMREAIADEPAASAKKMRVYGNRYAPYLPYYHLGLALARLGDCAGALDAWRRSEQQGAVSGYDEFQELQRMREECLASLPQPSPTATAMPATPTPAGPSPAELLATARSDAEAALAAANAAARAMRQKRDAADMVQHLRRDRQLAERVTAADELLASAKSRIDAGIAAGNPDELAEAARLAQDARLAMAALDQELTRISRQLAQQAEAEQRAETAARRRLVGEVNDLLAPAGEALAAGGELSGAAQRGLAGKKQTLEQVVARARAAVGETHSVAELEAVRDELRRATAVYRDAVNSALALESKPVPPTPTPKPTVVPEPTPSQQEIIPRPAGDPVETLRLASSAFLNGRYGAALDLLPEDLDAASRVAAVAHLVRAACQYYLFAAGGELEQGLRDGARRDAAKCRSLDAEVQPDTRFFSPAFVDFFAAAAH